MLTLLAPNLIEAVCTLRIMADKLAAVRRDMGEPVVSIGPQYIQLIARDLRIVRETAESLKLPGPKAAALRLSEVLETAPPSGICDFNLVNALSYGCGQLSQSLQDDLEARLIFSLPSAAAELLSDAAPPFGEDVENSFANAAEDISEAAKCFAFNRHTATVFHLMRAMECAVQQLASKLGIANVDRVWGNLVADIDKAVEALPNGAQREAWSGVHSHLYHVKQAWRNGTMHPKQTYTEEEASAVYQAVKSFMVHLAPLV
jgi:hypothetical protein